MSAVLDVLGKRADRALKGAEAALVLGAFLASAGVVMVASIHLANAAAQPPQGTGAVDPKMH